MSEAATIERLRLARAAIIRCQFLSGHLVTAITRIDDLIALLEFREWRARRHVNG